MLMKLLTIKLKDIGKFEDFSADISGQMVGIVGQNGSGKSTLLRSIHFAITGDSSRLGKRDAVSVTRTTKDVQPFVQLSFDPEDGDPTPVVITRWLPVGNKEGMRKLIRGDQAEIVDAEIKRMVRNWTDMDPTALSDLIFVDQGKLNDVVDDQPAKRAEVLQRLFGFAEATKARDAVIHFLDDIPGIPDIDTINTLESQIADLELNVKDLNNQLKLIGPDVDDSDARNTLRLYESGRLNELERTRLMTERGLYIDRLNQKPVPMPDRSLLKEAKNIISSWKTYHEFNNRFNNLVDRRNSINDALISLTPLTHPGEPPSPPDELSTLKNLYGVFSAILSCDIGGMCPVCFTNGIVNESLKDNARNSIDRMQKLETEYKHKLKLHKDLEQSYQQYNYQLISYQEQLKTCEEAINKIKEIEPPKPDISEQDAEAVIRTITKDINDFDFDNNERELVRQKLEVCDKKLLKLNNVVLVSEDDVKKAHETIERSIRISTEKRAITKQIDECNKLLFSSRQEWMLLKSKYDRSVKLANFRNKLISVRDLLHRDAAPAVAARNCLKTLMTDLELRLKQLGAPFIIEADEDGHLFAIFNDGNKKKKVKAQLLSGGQKAVLGLAWRLAIIDRYAPRAGVLCLDEPTTGLDVERILSLRNALEAWKPHGSGRQFIVVTHDRRLLGVMDSVIELN